MNYTKTALVALLGLLASCSSTIDRRIDPDSPDAVGGAGIDSMDFNVMADRMTASIVAQGIFQSVPASQRKSLYIIKMRNDSSQPGLGDKVITMVRTRLFRALSGNVKILDRSSESAEAVERERAAKRSGAVTTNPDLQGDVAGADYILKGTIKDQTKSDGSLRSKFFLVTFELTNLETQELAWTDEYQVKFESEKSVIFQ